MNCLPCLRGKKSKGKKPDEKNEDKKEEGELPVAQPKENPLKKQTTGMFIRIEFFIISMHRFYLFFS